MMKRLTASSQEMSIYHVFGFNSVLSCYFLFLSHMSSVSPINLLSAQSTCFPSLRCQVIRICCFRPVSAFPVQFQFVLVLFFSSIFLPQPAPSVLPGTVFSFMSLELTFCFFSPPIFGFHFET